MRKVFVLAPGEDWIVDRFVDEFNADNADIIVKNPKDADVIWALADWCFNKLPYEVLGQKKIVTSVHHIVPEKFGPVAADEFRRRDQFTSAYHVYNAETENFIRKYTQKPIHLLHYWANDKIWRPTGNKLELRQKYGIPGSAFVIGSFQRDTEGAGIHNGVFLPKLEKGPDLLCDAIISMARQRDDVHVLLAGWRRQYVISRLDGKVPFTYIERPSQETVNELYQTLDLYPCTSRCEGGPQSLIECGLLGIPVVSREVGIASQVLPRSAINDDVLLASPTIPNVQRWRLPEGYEPYRNMLQLV